MMISIRRYQADPTIVDVVIHRVEEQFLPLVSTVSGFVAYYMLVDKDGEISTITICTDQEGLVESNRRAQDYSKAYLADLLSNLAMVEVITGEVRASKII